MSRNSVRSQLPATRVLAALAVPAGMSVLVTVVDAAIFPFCAAVSLVVAAICAVIASMSLRSTVESWCSGAAIPFEITRTNTLLASLATSGFWLVATVFADMGAALPAVLAMSSIGVWCAMVDQSTMRIPTSAAYAAAAMTLALIGIAGLVDSEPSVILRAAAGGIVTALIYLLVAGVTGGGVGLGDVRLSVSLGTVLGYQSWSSVGAGLILPVILMFPLAIFAIVRRRITRTDAASRDIAAGPALVASCALALALNS